MAINKTKFSFNPLTGQFDQINDVDQGIFIKKHITRNLRIPSGYYLERHGPIIDAGFEIFIESDGELYLT